MKKPRLVNFLIIITILILHAVILSGAKERPPSPGNPTSMDKIPQAAGDMIKKLRLEPLPEATGVFFRETYRSKFQADTEKPRSCATMIYDLIQADTIDPWHRISSDEIFIHHSGIPVTLLLLFPNGTWEEIILGDNVLEGETPSCVVPAGTWMSLALKNRSPECWALLSVIVVPGFDYEDFEKGESAKLIKQYPGAASRIRELGFDRVPSDKPDPRSKSKVKK